MYKKLNNWHGVLKNVNPLADRIKGINRYDISIIVRIEIKKKWVNLSHILTVPHWCHNGSMCWWKLRLPSSWLQQASYTVLGMLVMVANTCHSCCGDCERVFMPAVLVQPSLWLGGAAVGLWCGWVVSCGHSFSGLILGPISETFRSPWSKSSCR